MNRAVALVAAGTLAAACAEPPPVANPSPFDVDDPAAQPEPEPTEPDQLPVIEVEPDEPEPGVIDRESLHRVLAGGPGAYAGEVMVEAVVVDGDLFGWRLTRWQVGWSGLAVGDVVLSVNGVEIVRPDDLMDLWQSLYDASEIAIRVERDGAEVVRRFAVR